MATKKIAVLLYPGCIFFEIAAAVELLAQYCELSYYTPDGSVHISSNGTYLCAAGSYADIANASAIIVPGGNPDSIIPLRLASDCLKEGYANGAVLAGICAGALVLASSDLLINKRVTHNYTLEFVPQQVVDFVQIIWQGVVYERANIVVDGRLITAQPWAVFEFAAAIALALGVFSQLQLEDYISYYQR
ncbi:DJ-1/PfpI family protein [Iodobacter sp. CM08]|uniref:DJ-1/PfpI family protein n=1 Tax=Iodobacter sp. CM08 TaxID=3085902 RepID=UPI0029811172|nr:DJ-1/PfpI family protein [Iodobacter sp. CM08]MDW5416026.1 DJ-1/PfpI family protein [Iodobacter sp. CM08]